MRGKREKEREEGREDREARPREKRKQHHSSRLGGGSWVATRKGRGNRGVGGAAHIPPGTPSPWGG